jgi:hypothetical protein
MKNSELRRRNMEDPSLRTSSNSQVLSTSIQNKQMGDQFDNAKGIVLPQIKALST